MNAEAPIKAPLTDAKVAAALKLSEAAAQYAKRLQHDPRLMRESTQYALLNLADAVCDVIDDGDALATARDIRAELCIDEEGNPLDGNGFPLDRDCARKVLHIDGSWEWAA